MISLLYDNLEYHHLREVVDVGLGREDFNGLAEKGLGEPDMDRGHD